VNGGAVAPVGGGAAAVSPPNVANALPVRPSATATSETLMNGVAVDPTSTSAPPTATAIQTPAEPTATATPSVAVYDENRLRDVLGKAQTSYAGSIPERAWNVELAAKRLNGTKVGPGEVFSFNKAVGATTLKAGFKIGYGITMNDGNPETVPSVAGGICQVATTVFQAAFWAGLPFVERHYHLYWIPRYGVAPSGRTGMDATVDDPGVDLKFKNTTGDWLRLDSWVDGANVGFSIKGVDPGWDVEAGKPKIFEPVKANPEPVRQDDPTMPAGKEIIVEHAEDGFKVTMSRLVKLKGKTVDELTYTNNYRPSRNVTLVGTKGATPRPSTTVTVSPVASGTPAGSPTPARTPTPAAPTATPAPKPAATVAGGQIRVPSLVGMPEAQARQTVDASNLANTYTNYQGQGQVPPNVLNSVPVGSVLSQNPVAGTVVAPGTTIFLAVRKS
jgi:hypothetical protein